MYIGVDLHRKRSQLAAIDAAGEAIFNRSIPSQADEFLRVFGELGPEPIEVAFRTHVLTREAPLHDIQALLAGLAASGERRRSQFRLLVVSWGGRP